MTDSILTSVKKIIGLDESYEVFDPDIIICINSEFSKLSMRGIGSDEAFSIEDKSAVWSDFIQDKTLLGMIPQYIGINVKLAFDPPQSSFVLEALKERANELEFLLQIRGDNT